MPSAFRWRPLDRFDDRGVPKLHNLKLAARAGFAVPETAWARAADLAARPDVGPPGGMAAPWMVRSGSPTEDTAASSNAGRYLSLAVADPGEFAGAVARVVAALPLGPDGLPLGVVFVQPRIEAETAGVTFFDGFYFEEARAQGSNRGLTAGLERGEVRRGQVDPGDPHGAWLVRLHRRFGGRIDVEWATPSGAGPTLLQVRPAPFPIRRSETLSLANHKEILGDPPSPWMVGLLVEVARPVMGAFEAVDPAIAAWEEPYAVELGERAWLNLSAFFRMMDRWGFPRSMVTRGVGGEGGGLPGDRLRPGRLLRMAPVLIRKGIGDHATLFAIGSHFRRLDARLDAAGTLAELWEANVWGLELSIRSNMAIMSLLMVASTVRSKLGLAQAGRVVTHEMMARYAELASRPGLEDRLAGLDAWLEAYGHRGPLESDPARPRFAELRDALRVGLERGPAPRPTPTPRPSPLRAALARPFFLLDEVRERFRDRLMRWWRRLRARILEQARLAVDAGHLDDPSDVFLLRGADLAADPGTWRARVVERRRAVELAGSFRLPTTAAREEIEAILGRQAEDLVVGPEKADAPRRFRGIGLGSKVVEGVAVRGVDLAAFLAGRDLPGSAILVASTLEPSWAVVFPRFSAIVVELGGELSHASILMREAGIPSIVNAPGAFLGIPDGARVVVDPGRGEVRVEG